MRILLVVSMICLLFIHVPVHANEDTDMPLVIAHRGASAHYPENTIPSYVAAYESGADYLEIDLQLTKDGELVTIHDETVDRTTNGKGKVNSYTLSELKKLDAGSWLSPKFKGTTIPTLDEVFKRFGNKAKYYIEVKKPTKNKDMETKLLEVIKRNNIKAENLIIQSFHMKSLEQIHQINPEIKLVMLYWKKNSIPTEDLDKLKSFAFAIGMNHDLVTNQIVQEVHDVGLQLHVFTANTVDEIKRAMDLGVEGIFSDDPEKVLNIRNRHQ